MSYQQWVDQAGGLYKFLDTYLIEHSNETVLELGSGNSTRIFAARAKRVISLDVVPTAAVQPVCEHNSASTLEQNVTPITGDILTMDLSPLQHECITIIFFDVGNTVEDKWIYSKAYHRLKDAQVLTNQTLLIDNADAAPEFLQELSTAGYKITDFIQQAIATPKRKTA